MTTRKEEREQRRAQRLQAEQREAEARRRRLVAGYVVAGLLTAAVVVGLVIVVAGSGGGGGETQRAAEEAENAHINPDVGVTDGLKPDNREGTEPPPVQNAILERAASAAGCETMLDLPDEGAEHFAEEQEGKYDTNPPTSGNHFGSNEVGTGALADGAYAETPYIPRAVHSLEHGRIAIQYSPDLPEEDQLAIKGVFDESPGGVLLYPNPEMPYEVAATAWTQLLGCERYQGRATLDAIRAFRDTYRNQGPEAVAIL